MVQRVETESQDRKERKESKECKGIEAQGGRKEIKATTANKDRWVTGELRAHAENKALLARKVCKDPLDRRVNTGLQAVRAQWVTKGRKEIKEREGRQASQDELTHTSRSFRILRYASQRAKSSR